MARNGTTGEDFVVALAGNPNVGKTCIFNSLTGARQHVANYPGVTVGVATGRFRRSGSSFRVIDLPGTYSLTANSDDEREARNILIDQRPDVVVNVVDATNLERNLYLTVQLLELGLNTVLALNMSDEAREQGLMPDVELLSTIMSVPIVETVGNRGTGAEALREAILQAALHPGTTPEIGFGRDADREISRIRETLQDCGAAGQPPRYAATKLLENDPDLIERMRSSSGEEACRPAFEQAAHSRQYLETLLGENPEVLLAEYRHGIAAGAVAEATRSAPRRRTTPPPLTQKLDNILLNRFFGLPIFAIAMYLTFWITFGVGSPLMGLLERLFDLLAVTVASAMPQGPLQSLLVDGIIGGVGGVLVFVPNIALLFLAISVLEDSGYMARAAFLVDGFMHRIGLHGRSFIPMLIGFGCTVPAVMATRVLDSRRDRLTTMMILPLMSCGAKLPVYLLVAGAFFPRHRATALWLIYTAGILMAIGLARVLRSTVLRGDNTPFVMELPPYRLPTLRSLAIHIWQRVSHYLLKAATVILAFSVVLWALSYFPRPPSPAEGGSLPASAIEDGQAPDALAYSALGLFGKAIEPGVEPLGFDWRIGTALTGALGAKEIFVSQMGILHSMDPTEAGGSSELMARLRNRYDAITGIGMMLFILIMAPCIPTFVMVRKESGSYAWAIGQFVGLTALAYLVVLIFNQAARFLAG